MTLPEFCLIQDGFVKKFEMESRERWELTRWQTYLLLQPHSDKGKLNNVKQLAVFPWEQPDKEAKEVLQNKDLFKIFPDTI